MNNYPTLMQSELEAAPWNEHKSIKIPVTVSITMSKDVEIEVDDYKLDSYGNPDFSDSDLESAVDNQMLLPTDEFKDWTVDDFEVYP